ncbi:MAG: ABC transporter ATP-binding protein [Candidatus Neomarinimicrobiota bacterium]
MPDLNAIETNKLGKKYRLDKVGRPDNLREVIASFFKLPIGATKSVIRKNPIQGRELWAIREVDLQVRAGEVLGIIGKNGAGKSTLLKVLSRVTEASEGSAIVRGRIASLLEIGIGFHPDLTGRENVFLNAALLGMKKAEVKSRFDEIVEFAGVGNFIDTQVKKYSSGMFVRLAFSIAAHLDSEIVFIDEVLAVGDTDFQRKCLNKIQSLAEYGRTILFVSHNLSAVERLCGRCLVFDHGRIGYDGKTSEALEYYRTDVLEKVAG